MQIIMNYDLFLKKARRVKLNNAVARKGSEPTCHIHLGNSPELSLIHNHIMGPECEGEVRKVAHIRNETARSALLFEGIEGNVAHDIFGDT